MIMRPITFRLSQSDFEKIEQLAQKKALDMAEIIRMLVHIGLTVEEAATDNSADGHDHISPQEQKFLWKTMLTWELESRYLLRHLVDNLIQGQAENRTALMEESKHQAEVYVNQLLKINPHD
jgi:hypothetical protein